MMQLRTFLERGDAHVQDCIIASVRPLVAPKFGIRRIRWYEETPTEAYYRDLVNGEMLTVRDVAKRRIEYCDVAAVEAFLSLVEDRTGYANFSSPSEVSDAIRVFEPGAHAGEVLLFYLEAL